MITVVEIKKKTLKLLLLNKKTFLYRSLDNNHMNGLERQQMLRFLRKLIIVNHHGNNEALPATLLSCLLAHCREGALYRDRVYKTCVFLLAELG